ERRQPHAASLRGHHDTVGQYDAELRALPVLPALFGELALAGLVGLLIGALGLPLAALESADHRQNAGGSTCVEHFQFQAALAIPIDGSRGRTGDPCSRPSLDLEGLP